MRIRSASGKQRAVGGGRPAGGWLLIDLLCLSFEREAVPFLSFTEVLAD
jgi:hypothetical protein